MAYLEIGGTSSTLTSLTLTTSGYIQLSSSGTATVGSIRAASTTTVIASRNNAGTNNISLLETDASDDILIGAVTAGVRPAYVILDATTGWLARIAGNNYLTLSTTVFQIVPSNVRFTETTSTPALYQDNKTSEVATNAFQIRAQGAWTGASSNINGGALRLQGGTAKTDTTSGLRGGVRCELSSGGDVMIEASEVALNRRVVALNRHSAISATEVPSGDGVVYVGDTTTAPSSNPVSGVLLYSSAGLGLFYNASGAPVQTVTTSRLSKALSDTDATLTNGEYTRTILDFTGTLGALRNITLPLVSGYQWTVRNGTNQSLTFKGASGGTVTVATGKVAIIFCDGTNIVRLTADT